MQIIIFIVKYNKTLFFTGQSPVSPNVSHTFFAPIQPAPVLLSAAANAHAQQSSNIANIIEKTRQEKLHENLSKVLLFCKLQLTFSFFLFQHFIKGRGPHWVKFIMYFNNFEKKS